MSAASARYFTNDQALSRRDPKQELISSLERLVKGFPPKSLQPGGGFYYGPMSIALLFFVLTKHYDDLKIGDQPLTAWFDAYLAVRPDAPRNGLQAGRCGVMEDLLSLAALTAAASKHRAAAAKLCDCAAIATQPTTSNEWLYGRAGYLYLLRFIKPAFTDDLEILARIERTAHATIQAILASPRPWTWHGKIYVGAVHGIIGILTQIVLTDPSYAPRVEHHLDSLLQNQYESGNWPSSLPAGSDRLVQFCHGAPGVVASLLSIRKYFPNLDDRIEEAIVAGRAVIREKGVLTKEPCLCHGTTGNALALEDEDFEHFLSLTSDARIKELEDEAAMEPSDHPEGLWCGEAGRAWAWAVADKGLEKRVIGYNDI